MKKVFSFVLALLLVLSVVWTPALAETKGKTMIALSHRGTITLSLGETLKLAATVTPEAEVKWSSSKAKVAQVTADGLVTTSAEGTATITAKAGGKSAKVKIKVVDPHKPTKVSISQGKAVTINLGETLTLGTVLAPETAKATLTWKSSKAKIATVDANGTVTALNEGKAKITVQTHNKKKATIAVTVVDPYKPTGVTIAQGKKATMMVGDALDLMVTMKPTTARKDLTFKSSKPKVASVDPNGRVTALQKGTVKITVTSKSNKKAKATISITVKVAPVNLDLSVYYGQNAKTVKSKLGLIENVNNPVPAEGGKYAFEMHSSGQKRGTPFIGMLGIGPTKSIEEATIQLVSLRYQTKYNIFGISPGMSLNDAETVIQKAGWKIVNRWDSGCDYYNSARNLDMHIDATNGKVDFITVWTLGLYDF